MQASVIYVLIVQRTGISISVRDNKNYTMFFKGFIMIVKSTKEGKG